MDRLDRLVAYVDGELTSDARAAFEAELAADAALRAELAALERADGALGQLTSPTPADGFEDRLRAGLAPTLAEVLGTSSSVGATAGTEADTAMAAGHHVDAASGHATHGPGADAAFEDELAARRARRGDGSGSTPRWVRLTASAAAGVAILAGGGLVLSGALTGSDDDAFPDAGTMEATDDDAADEGAATALRSGPVGPEIVSDGRDLDDDEVDALLAAGVVRELVELGVDPVRGDELATDFQSQLGLGPSEESAPEIAGDEQADDASDASDEAETESSDGAEIDDPIARCVAEVTRDAPSAIPGYVELATYQGVEVVVIGLVTVDPSTGAYTRAEAWVLDRDTCQTLRFSQRS